MNFTKISLVILISLSMQPVSCVPAQTIGLNFTAATVVDVPYADFTPPNQSGWVGPEQYILMSYGVIRSFNKFTGQPDGILNIDAGSFFGVTAEDVRIDYSRYADRWFMSCENNDLTVGYPDELLIAWSDSGVITPQTVWTIYTFTNEQIVPQQDIPADGPADLDYQQLATDANAVYISVDTFNTLNGTTEDYLGSSVVVIPNSSFVAGNTFNYTVFPGVLGPDTIPAYLESRFTPPADNFDPSPTFGYLLNTAYDGTMGNGTGVLLNFFRILNSGSANPTLGPLIDISVPLYANGNQISNPLGNAPHKGNLFGTNGYLQTGNFNSMEAICVRNKQLYACQAITLDSTGTGNPNGDRTGVRWYQFDLTGDPTGQGQGVETESTVPVLIQVGTLYDSTPTNPQNYFIPSIMTNKNSDLIITGTTSGANNYTNVFYAGRKASDPLGTLREPILITNNPGNPYNVSLLVPQTGQRWGDLSSLAPDPSNDLDIWSTGEWAGLVNGWAIQATQLIPAAA